MRQIILFILSLFFFSAAHLAAADQPTKARAWSDFIYQGLSFEHSQQTNKAINSYLDSLDKYQNSIALFRLGKIYRHQGRYKQAVKYFKQLLKLDSSIRLANYYLGECLAKQNKNKEAYKFLSRAANFYPETEEISELFKAVKEKLGQNFFVTKKKLKDKQRRQVKLPSYLADEEIPKIAVGLAKGLKQFSFSCSGEFVVSDGVNTFKGEPNLFYVLVVKNKDLVLKSYQDDSQYGIFSESVKITPSGDHQRQEPLYLLDIVYGRGDFWHKTIDRAYRGNIEVLLKKATLTLINHLSVEEYLYGVLSAEIPHRSHPAALRAQAVAARTLVFKNRGRHRKEGFNFCADVHCQVYKGLLAETAPTSRAVDATRGQILKNNDRPIETFYHSNCGGCLASDVFGGQEYLTNKVDSRAGFLPRSSQEVEKWFIDPPATFCSRASGAKYRWQRIYDREDFLIAFGFQLEEFKSFNSQEKGECFHHKQVEVISAKGKSKLKGDLTIRNYFDRLRSSAFKLEIKKTPDSVSQALIIWGAGFGHGTGLCQEGAMAMARQGYSHQEILEHYYPKAELEKVY